MKKKYKNPGKPGRRTAIPPEIEEKIANALKEASRQGMGISRRQLLRRVGTLCKKIKLEARQFNRQIPGKDWFAGFIYEEASYALNSQTRKVKCIQSQND